MSDNSLQLRLNDSLSVLASARRSEDFVWDRHRFYHRCAQNSDAEFDIYVKFK